MTPDESSEPGGWCTDPLNPNPNKPLSKNAMHAEAGALLAKKQVSETLLVPVRCVMLLALWTLNVPTGIHQNETANYRVCHFVNLLKKSAFPVSAMAPN